MQGVKRAVGLDEDAPLQFQSIHGNLQCGQTIEFAVTLPVEIHGAGFGPADGASQAVATPGKPPGGLREVGDHIGKLVELGRVDGTKFGQAPQGAFYRTQTTSLRCLRLRWKRADTARFHCSP